MFLLFVLAALLIPILLAGGVLALFWRRKRRAIARWCATAYGALVAVLLVGIGPYLLAWALVHAGTRPPDRALKETPGTYGVIFEDLVFESRDSVRLSGWFIPPSGRNAVIICTHGLFRNRVETLSRIVPLARTGYGALLYDARSHGSSDKARVSLGYFEKNDVLGAVDYVKRRYQDSFDGPSIVLLGVSMGAVATLEAAASDVLAASSAALFVTPAALAGSAAFQTLTDLATVPWDASLGYNAKLSLGASRTLALPTNAFQGETLTLYVQPGGARTLSFASGFYFSQDGVPPGSTIPAVWDIYSLQCWTPGVAFFISQVARGVALP